MEEDLNLEGNFISKIDVIADSQWEQRIGIQVVMPANRSEESA